MPAWFNRALSSINSSRQEAQDLQPTAPPVGNHPDMYPIDELKRSIEVLFVEHESWLFALINECHPDLPLLELLDLAPPDSKSALAHRAVFDWEQFEVTTAWMEKAPGLWYPDIKLMLRFNLLLKRASLQYDRHGQVWSMVGDLLLENLYLEDAALWPDLPDFFIPEDKVLLKH